MSKLDKETACGKRIKNNNGISMRDTHSNNTTPRISTLRALSGLSRLSSISLTNTSNKSMYHNMDDADDNNSTPIPLQLPLHSTVTPVDNVDVKIDDIRDSSVEEEDEDDAGFSILSGFEDGDFEDDQRNEMMFGLDRKINIIIGMPNESNLLSHAGSKSVPTNVDHIFESFNILAKCGFYSPKNVNELNKYQKRFSQIIAKSATPQ
eukprot:UN13772